MKRIVLLGATGSIGQQTLNVVRDNLDKFLINKISIGNNVKQLEAILDEFPSIKEVALIDTDAIEDLKIKYENVTFYSKNKGILQLLDNNDYDIVVNAIVGFAGLLPSIKTIKLGKILGLANKETMVVAGPIIVDILKEFPEAKILPIDSEHSAIFQCLDNNNHIDIKRLIITASGGSFRDKTYKELADVTVEEALNHPNWSMGASITIDSATMLNKGLEVIEAHYLFDIPYEKIEVVIHKESIIHSMVEYTDNSIIAQLSNPNMEQAIGYAINYPNRDIKNNLKPVDFVALKQLSFDTVAQHKYEGLILAYQVGMLGHSYMCVFNASKEVATQAFLDKKIKFLDIVKIVKCVVNDHKVIKNPLLSALIKVDAATRQYTEELIEKEYTNGLN